MNANHRLMRPRGCVFLARLSSLLVALTLSGACSRDDASALEKLAAKTKPSGLKVLLVGVDGATFDILKPLVEAGRVPTFARLMENGTHAVLKTERPMFSPAIWTTIVTGKPRRDHGIIHFQDAETGKLVSSSDRRTLALWNIASSFKLTNGWIGFWATWPAEPVNGYMISDRLAHTRWEAWTGEEAGGKSEMLVWPDNLLRDVRPYVVDPKQAPYEEIRKLADFTPEEIARMRAFEKPIFGHALSVLKFGYCAQRSFEKIALHMLENGKQPDLMGLFLIANDPICHTFWHYWQPDRFVGVDRETARRLGRIVPNFYIHNDRYLGELLSKIDKNTVVIVVSDHGFQASGLVPKPKPTGTLRPGVGGPRQGTAEQGVTQRLEALGYVGSDDKQAADADQVAVGQSGKHHINGVFIACGGPILKGKTTTANISDITPTILALLGLPVAKDMGGRVLTEMIDPAWLKAHPVRTTDSYESLIDRAELEASLSHGEDTANDYLKSLGYVGDDGAGGQREQPPPQD